MLLKNLILGIAIILPFAVNAESPPPPKAYIIAEIEVIDAATYEGYKSAVAPMVSRYGGHYIVRGGATQTYDGDAPKGRIILLEFPSMKMAQTFLNSDEYRPVAEIRQKSTKSRLFVVEGMPK
jgi:uncharacterized protein (DUF1330 family)